MEFLLNLLRIRRVEFRIAEIPILVIPILLERSLGAPPLTAQVFWEGAILFGFLFAFGDIINCLADRDLDAVYKSHLSRAVYRLGLPFVRFQVAASALAALGLAAHLSWALQRWTLLPLVAVGLALGAAYSVPPVRLKGRGLFHLVCLWLILFFGPMLFAAGLPRPLPSPALLLFAAAYATAQMGVVLVNSAEDYPEDLSAGVCNSIVRLGLRNGVALAAGMTAMGGVGLFGTAAWLYAARGLPGLAWLGLAPLAAGVLLVSSDIIRLARRIRVGDETDAVRRVKQSARRVPVWITGIAWTSLAVVGVLYGYRSPSPASRAAVPTRGIANQAPPGAVSGSERADGGLAADFSR